MNVPTSELDASSNDHAIRHCNPLPHNSSASQTRRPCRRGAALPPSHSQTCSKAPSSGHRQRVFSVPYHLLPVHPTFCRNSKGVKNVTHKVIKCLRRSPTLDIYGFCRSYGKVFARILPPSLFSSKSIFSTSFPIHILTQFPPSLLHRNRITHLQSCLWL
jgi:hypothetical protein